MYVISQPYVMHLLLQQDFLKYIIDDKTQILPLLLLIFFYCIYGHFFMLHDFTMYYQFC